jgi:cytoskeleton protein RodZ
MNAWTRFDMTEMSSDSGMPFASPSPGALIKSAREKQGLHLAILSVNLKVSVKQLEALEADQFDKLVEPVFARALAAKVCRIIKLDPAQVLSLMPVATNGLKPLNIIDSDGKASFVGQGSVRQHQGSWFSAKLGVLLLFVAFLVLAINSEWASEFLGLQQAPQAADVAPVMPPVQEPVAPDAAQNELPKAMVFESSPNAVTSPTPALTESAQTEVKK